MDMKAEVRLRIETIVTTPSRRLRMKNITQAPMHSTSKRTATDVDFLVNRLLVSQYAMADVTMTRNSGSNVLIIESLFSLVGNSEITHYPIVDESGRFGCQPNC